MRRIENLVSYPKRITVLSVALVLLLGLFGGVVGAGDTSTSDSVAIWFQVLPEVQVVSYAALELRHDHSGIEAVLLSNDEVAYTAELTGEDGRSEFTGVAPGDYTLVLNMDGFLRTVVMEVPVGDDAVTQVGTESEPVPLLAGDLNLDDTIRLADLNLVRAHWQEAVEGDKAHYDLSGDGRVGLMDLTYLRENYGKNTEDNATYIYNAFSANDPLESD